MRWVELDRRRGAQTKLGVSSSRERLDKADHLVHRLPIGKVERSEKVRVADIFGYAPP